MRVSDLILKKREGEAHSRTEIEQLISGYSKDEIPDYQMAAWAMAVYFQDLNFAETTYLTETMAQSGDMIDLSSLKGRVMDKHSTGGVGDKTTLVLVPLVSAAGIPIAKMSGRGLGHTGGTIDKLESIPGFKTNLSQQAFLTAVERIKAAVAGQTKSLAPADKKLYALRDVTATVESLPLIASSIMSKKIAGGAGGIVLDVKVGQGAFMKQKSRARELAKIMIKLGENFSRKIGAVLTDMNQPLGYKIGNSLEVIEALDTLKNEGPKDLKELCLTLGGEMLRLNGTVDTRQQGRIKLTRLLNEGKALEQMVQIIENQGGDSNIVEDYSLLPCSEYSIKVESEKTGFVEELDAYQIGLTALELGAGREEKGDQIDHGAGIILNKKYGDRVKKGDILGTLYTNQKEKLETGKDKLKQAFTFNNKKPKKRNLILEIM